MLYHSYFKHYIGMFKKVAHALDMWERSAISLTGEKHLYIVESFFIILNQNFGNSHPHRFSFCRHWKFSLFPVDILSDVVYFSQNSRSSASFQCRQLPAYCEQMYRLSLPGDCSLSLDLLNNVSSNRTNLVSAETRLLKHDPGSAGEHGQQMQRRPVHWWVRTWTKNKQTNKQTLLTLINFVFKLAEAPLFRPFAGPTLEHTVSLFFR